MTDESIDSILTENRVFPPGEDFTANARLKPVDVDALYREAEADHEAYWARLAREELEWSTPFEQILDGSEPQIVSSCLDPIVRRHFTSDLGRWPRECDQEYQFTAMLLGQRQRFLNSCSGPAPKVGINASEQTFSRQGRP